jgi:CheY-like chemotaxis protein
LARSLCRALSFHHDATALTSGAPAIARIEAGERFDVIVLDLTMPDISGAETYERIRAASQSQADRVLFITGGTFAQSAREFLASQSNRWMGKPCNIQALLGVIGEILAPPDAGPIDSAPPTGR